METNEERDTVFESMVNEAVRKALMEISSTLTSLILKSIEEKCVQTKEKIDDEASAAADRLAAALEMKK